MPSVRDTDLQREALRKVYPGAAWAKKVNLMNAQQVSAIYIRLKGQNKLK